MKPISAAGIFGDPAELDAFADWLAHQLLDPINDGLISEMIVYGPESEVFLSDTLAQGWVEAGKAARMLAVLIALNLDLSIYVCTFDDRADGTIETLRGWEFRDDHLEAMNVRLLAGLLPFSDSTGRIRYAEAWDIDLPERERPEEHRLG